MVYADGGSGTGVLFSPRVKEEWKKKRVEDMVGRLLGLLGHVSGERPGVGVLLRTGPRRNKFAGAYATNAPPVGLRLSEGRVDSLLLRQKPRRLRRAPPGAPPRAAFRIHPLR